MKLIRQFVLNYFAGAQTLGAKHKSNVIPNMSAPVPPAAKVTKTIVTSDKIYTPVGPYSQAVLANNSTLYVSGVLGLDREAQVVCGGIEAQTRQALENLKHVLEAGGASLESVVKTTILLNDMNDFRIFNQVYGEYFKKHAPARATYQVAKLPMGAAIEIEAVALGGELVVAESGPCPCTRA